MKIALPGVFERAVARTIQIHGSLGVSNEMPLARMLLSAFTLGIADGPTEVHETTLAREVLKDYTPAPGQWPTEHLPERVATARAKYASILTD